MQIYNCTEFTDELIVDDGSRRYDSCRFNNCFFTPVEWDEESKAGYRAWLAGIEATNPDHIFPQEPWSQKRFEQTPRQIEVECTRCGAKATLGGGCSECGKPTDE